MTKTCGNCKHWGKPGDELPTHRKCLAIDELPHPTPEEVGPAVINASEYADLATAADFGCTLFEPKESP